MMPTGVLTDALRAVCENMTHRLTSVQEDVARQDRPPKSVCGIPRATERTLSLKKKSACSILWGERV